MFGKLAQVAIAVHDIDVSRERWARVLGVDVPSVIVSDPGADVRAYFRGNPTADRVKLAFFDLGGVQLELFEPIGTENAWAEPLRSGGDRLHHLAFWVDHAPSAVAHLEACGAELIQRGDMGENAQYLYLDAEASLGTVIELFEANRSSLPGWEPS